MVQQNKAYDLSRDELVSSISPWNSYATSDGAGGGASIVDANLIGADDFITGKTVMIRSGPSKFETRIAGTFVPGTGTIPFAPGFNNQITAGTAYRILATGGGSSTLTQADILSDATPFPGADIPLIKVQSG